MSPNKPDRPALLVSETPLAAASAQNVPSDESPGDLKLMLVNESPDSQDPTEESRRSPTRGFNDSMQPTHAESSERRSWPIWLLGVTVIVGIIVIAWQARLVGDLETRVLGLSAELAQANDLVDAHRTHLGEIRGGVSDLSLRLEGLRVLVDSDPGSGVEKASLPAP